MSTRFLGLLATTAAVSVTLTAGIAAASASAATPPPSAPDPAPAAAPAAAPPPAAKDDAELKECRDADCDVKIRDGQTITLDEKYGLDPIRVRIDDNRVTFTIRGENTKMISTIDANSANTSATYNGVTFRPRMNKDGTMNLKISHD